MDVRARFLILLAATALAAAGCGGGNSNDDTTAATTPATTPTTTLPHPKPKHKRPPKPHLTDWPMFHPHLSPPRAVPAPARLGPPFRRRWRVGAPGLAEFPPSLAGGTLYWMRNEGKLYAISPARGHIKWTRKLGALAAVAPAIAEGRVFVTLLETSVGNGT